MEKCGTLKIKDNQWEGLSIQGRIPTLTGFVLIVLVVEDSLLEMK